MEVSELYGVVVGVAVTKAAAKLPRCKGALSEAAIATEGKNGKTKE